MAEATRALIRLGNARAESRRDHQRGHRPICRYRRRGRGAGSGVAARFFALQFADALGAADHGRTGNGQAIAMTLGLGLSRERWFWAVLASFLVFTNTEARVAIRRRLPRRSDRWGHRSIDRLLLATLLLPATSCRRWQSRVSPSSRLYLLQTSYATMTFFVSIALCLVYGMIGSLTLDLLLLRVEETRSARRWARWSPSSSFPARTWRVRARPRARQMVRGAYRAAECRRRRRAAPCVDRPVADAGCRLQGSGDGGAAARVVMVGCHQPDRSVRRWRSSSPPPTGRG